MKAPRRPPKSVQELIQDIPPARLLTTVVENPAVKPTVNGRYRHWDTLRHLDPPGDLSHEEWWVGIKLARSQIRQAVDLVDLDGHPFGIAMVGPLLQRLQYVDQHTSGRITISEQVTNPDTRRTYLVDSLIEEAITSSQLEGATTSRKVANEMLRSARRPRTKSEQMILNNYRAMQYVGERRDEPLTVEIVLELHRIVTDGTLDNPDAAGRPQTPDEGRVAVYDAEGNVLHRPPPAELLLDRLERMCAFANADDGDDEFLHPVVRSMLVHFWLAYDHPFEDGNGRTARALFYWSMLHRGYWLTEYLSISSILRKAPAKYGRSFLYTEWDDNDLTYFVLYQLSVVQRAIDALSAYLRRKMREVRDAEKLLRTTTLNHRQIALIGHALRTPGASYSFRSHARSHGVVYQSARNDLLDLEARGLLVKRKAGRAFQFLPVEDLAERLGRL